MKTEELKERIRKVLNKLLKGGIIKDYSINFVEGEAIHGHIKREEK